MHWSSARAKLDCQFGFEWTAFMASSQSLVPAMNRPEHVQRLQEALQSKEPADGLYRLAVSLRDEGLSQIELYVLFEQSHLATSSDDPRYDAIADTMEVTYGGSWAKGRGIYPTELSEEELNQYRKLTD